MTLINENVNRLLNHFNDLKYGNDIFDENDLVFLDEYFKRFLSLLLVKESIENSNNFDIHNVDENVITDITRSTKRLAKKNREAAKLSHILKKNNFKFFLQCLKEISNGEHITIPYDGDLYEIEFETIEREVINENYAYSNDDSSVTESDQVDNRKENGDFQLIGLHRDPKQSLGITVVQHVFPFNGVNISRCCVERILVNSLIDKQGILQVGDIIFEVNDQIVENPDSLQRIILKSSGTITFKVLKTFSRPKSRNIEKTYVRALFDYDPAQDQYLPSKSIGLQFNTRDVFEVINRDDINYWQALPLNSVNCQAYLIPSQSFQEKVISNKRINLVHDTNGTFGRKKSKKTDLFCAKNAADINNEADLHTYEEVVKVQSSRSPCVVLVGPTGIGKKAIKHNLVSSDPNRFAYPMKDTSEPKKNRGQQLFNHINRNTMMTDIKAGEYVCIEEIQNEIYGIRISNIKDIINQGKTAVLDCKPKDVYNLKTPLFNPFVIMITAPSFNILDSLQKDGLQRSLTNNKRNESELRAIIQDSISFEKEYKHIFNEVIMNQNINETTSEILNRLNYFESQESWIPASWEYDITVMPVLKKNQMKKPTEVKGSNSTQRRYEKKADRPSIVSSNKLNPSIETVGRKEETYISDSTHTSDSEPDLVIAKSVKSQVKKHAVIVDNRGPKQVQLAEEAKEPIQKNKIISHKSSKIEKPVQSQKMVIKSLRNDDSSGISETSSDED